MKTGELVDYVDAKGKFIGYCLRTEAEDKNLSTRNVLVFIFDSSEKVWLQKRPITKKHYPGLYDISACGGIEHGEKPIVAAGREQFEEMGFRCKLHFVERFLNRFPDEDNTIMRCRQSYLYIGICDEQPQTNDEVDEFVSFKAHEILKQAEEHPERFVPSLAKELNKAVRAYEKLAK